MPQYKRYAFRNPDGTHYYTVAPAGLRRYRKLDKIQAVYGMDEIKIDGCWTWLASVVDEIERQLYPHKP